MQPFFLITVLNVKFDFFFNFMKKHAKKNTNFKRRKKPPNLVFKYHKCTGVSDAYFNGNFNSGKSPSH